MALLAWLRKNSIIIATILLGVFLFTYRLSSIPSAVYCDEAVVGNNARSIIETGRDEYGKIFPINFKFFGSYTPGLFVYAETIPVKLFGLNPFSIRILSAISLLALAFFIYRQFGSLAAFVFIITPWTIFNARLGYETTFAFTLISLGVLLYKKPTLSFFLISLSAYAGHTERYLAPLFIILIWAIFYRHHKITKSLIIAFIIQIPNLFLLLTPSFWIKNDSLTSAFFSQYLSYFSPRNLFNQEDYQLQRSIPQLSVFYFWMFVPWLAGLFQIYKNIKKPFYQYLLGLILISPLPAALANTNYSTQRALPLLLPYSLVISLGISQLIKNKIIKIIFIILIPISAILFFRSYFILLPTERAQAWDYGYQQLSEYILKHPEQQFVIDNGRSVPYSLLLFYLQPPMAQYQQQNNYFGRNYYDDTSFLGTAKINNISVRPIVWQADVYRSQVIVGDDLTISDQQIKEHYLKIIKVKYCFKRTKLILN